MVMIRQFWIWPTTSQKQRINTYRWYREIHGPEYLRYWGPYMTRYETYRSYDAPADAIQTFGTWNNRTAEMWFISYEHWQEAMQPWGGATPPKVVETPNPNDWKIVNCLIPSRPTQNFMGTTLAPEDKTIVRWITMIRYPEGVSADEGDKWFLDIHSQEVMKQPGLLRYFSFRTLDADHPRRPTPQVPRPFHRLVEQWYEDFEGWRKAVLESGIKYTPPPWAEINAPPFLKPGVNFVNTFIGETPEIDFMRDVRPRP